MKSVSLGVVCLLLATTAISQTTKPAPTLKPRPSESNELIPGSNVAPDAPVITIQGLCERPPNSNATPVDCNTVITRADFEKLINAVQPNMPAASRKPFATRYVTILLLSEKAHEMGLDKTPEFDEQMYIARLQLLARQAAEKMQRDAANVPESEISDYYQQHASEYKSISFERIFIPKQKVETAGKTNELHPGKADEASEAQLKDEADKLRARAAAGEDPTKLQQEANDFAGNKTKVTNVKVENMRKTSIPPTDASIFDLKAGEVSQVFSDPTGYRIYKVTEVKDLPLASVHDEILHAIQGQNMKNAFDSLQNSAKTTFDNSYFVTPAAPSLRNPGEAPAPQSTTPPPGKK
ncbi:MAG TPA: peptidylprolyl isomerase [Terriglobales bacterium]|nr:peptidylprolyl isomerase [Terriglobales bacterium]